VPSRLRRLGRVLLVLVAVVALSRLLAATGHVGDGVALLLGVFGGVGVLLVVASQVR
jgi:hypothetical protein